MKKILLVVMFLTLLCNSVFAQEKKTGAGKDAVTKLFERAISPLEAIIGPATELGRIVVTPTKLDEKLGAQSSAVTVLTESDFDRKKVEYVKSALKEEMGLDIVESGSFTGQTSAFIRGANANHTLVMIDGIKVYDPISTNGAYNLAHLTLDNVGQIEVVRGSQSALYGSDAIGGVINIITKKAEEPYFNTSFEAGSFSTFKESFGMGSKEKGLSYSVAGSHEKSRGISSAQAKNNNPELDGYGRYAISARIEYDAIDDLKVGGTFRNTSTRFGYDSFRKDYPNLFQRDYETLVSSYVEHKPIDYYSYHVKLGWMYNFRRDNDDRYSGWAYYLRDWYEGYLFKLDYRNNIHLGEIDVFTVGYEYTWEVGDYYYYLDWGSGNSEDDMPKVFSRNGSFYLQNRLNIQDRLTSTQGMRIDHHSQAGTHITYKVDGSYLFETGTKVRGGWATGLKVPTLYQLNAVAASPDAWGWGGFGGGNVNLKPETSQSYELGIDQYLFGDRLILNATYFNLMLHDLINTTTNSVFYTSKFENTGKARSYGIELGAKAKPIDTVNLGASYTYDYTKDFSTDRPLLRRPLHKLKISSWMQISPKWDVDLEVLVNGLRYDVNVDKLKPYTVVNISTNYKIAKNLDIYLKIANMFNKRYEEVRGFGESPFAAYAGAKSSF
ncbi:MAG: TonB-dependent receptor [Candidatus Omnitrophota bacterium]|nr:TonB-dependent receptor [Candidatus Omnitrophota bacterium]